MKFLKSTMAIVALLAIGSVDAKQVRGAATTTPTRTPMPKPISQPVSRPVSQDSEKYDALFKLITERGTDIIVANNQSTQAIIKSIENSGLSAQQKDNLLAKANNTQREIINNCNQKIKLITKDMSLNYDEPSELLNEAL